MTLSNPRTVTFVLLLAGLLGAPGHSRGNALVVDYQLLNEEGALSHVIPRGTQDVRMVAERVVLVPYWDSRSGRPQVLVHVWYDLLSQRAYTGLPVGFPEVKGAYRYFNGGGRDGKGALKLRQPTIWRFTARLGTKRLKVQEHPGVARYRRWFTFAVPMPAKRKVRLHTLYLSRFGRALKYYYYLGFERERSKPDAISTTYWIDYVLHTGGRWQGKIGRGRVEIFAEGRHHLLKRYTNLKPTLKDDLTVRLALGRAALPKVNEETFDGMKYSKRAISTLRRIDRLPLVQESSMLKSTEVERLGALAVDGDLATGWISAPGKAVGAWLQVPADPGRALRELQLWSLRRKGLSRPARLEVRCRYRRRGSVRSRRLLVASVPNSVGPHRLGLGSATGCAALRLIVKAVHGHAAASVGLAEVKQSYSTAPKGAPKKIKVLPCCFRPEGQPRRALLSVRGAIAKLSQKYLGWGFEKARLSDVRWSADGTVVHYVLWLENEHHDAKAVLMGYFVEVATGRTLRRYRLDRAGVLPKPYNGHWKGALPFEAAVLLLKRYGFTSTSTRASRVAPKVAQSSPKLHLHASLARLCGRLRVRPRKTGFSWRYEPNMVARVQAKVPGQLQLQLQLQPRGLGQATPKSRRSLARRRPFLDHALARRHQRARVRRFKKFKEEATAAKEYKYDNKVPIPAQFYRLYPQVHGFNGWVTFFWQPQGRAVLAAWRDHRWLTGLLPDDSLKLKHLTPRSWSRLDYGRTHIQVAVFPLGSVKRTTLKFPGMSVTAGGARPGPSSGAMSGHPAPIRKSHTGCGCLSSSRTPELPALLLFTLALVLDQAHFIDV